MTKIQQARFYVSILVGVGFVMGAISSVLALLLTNNLENMQNFLIIGFRIAIFAVLIAGWVLAVLRTNKEEKILSDAIYRLSIGIGTLVGTLTFFFPVYVALGTTEYDSVSFVSDILYSSILYLIIAVIADFIFPQVYRMYCLYRLKQTKDQ